MMRRKFIILSVFFLLVFLVVICPGTAFAEFGTTDKVSFWIHAIEFTQAENHGFNINDRGYIRPTVGSDITFYAPLKVPNGVLVTDIVFFYYHLIGETIPIDFSVQYSVANGTYGAIDRVSSTPNGYGIVDTDAGAPIDNKNMYRLVVDFPEKEFKNLWFKGVRVSYLRQISPAPATSSFPDVLTDDTHFRSIEALRASGITIGFGDGTYRPENFVTRAEMATFLSRALGLHHP